MSDVAEKFSGWAVVEIMGHRRVAGHVTEQAIAGATLLRVDVPVTKADPRDAYDHDGPTEAYTQFYGAASIFCLTPCDESSAMRVARTIERGRQPVARRLTAGAPTDDDDIVDGEWREDRDDDGEGPF